MISIHLKEIIESALREDIGMGDLTSKSIFDADHCSKGIFVSKAQGALAGLDVLQIAYN
jgi:nicotinate-nucleotide pyrophosphorylase